MIIFARTELQQLELSIRKWKEIADFEVCEHLEYVELRRIRVRTPGKGIGEQAIRRLQAYSEWAGVPILLTPNPDGGKKTALLRFYRRLGFRKATHKENLAYGNGWDAYWIWKPKFNVKFPQLDLLGVA